MFISSLTLSLLLLLKVTQSFPSENHLTGDNDSIRPRENGPNRDVYVVTNYKPYKGAKPEFVDGESVFPSHSYLYVAGNPQDGPLKIEIGDDKNFVLTDGGCHIRALDLAPNNMGKFPKESAYISVDYQGQTKFRNADFMDTQTGKGMVANAWAADPIYRTGPPNAGNINTCNTFLQRLLRSELRLPISSKASDYFRKARIWTEKVNPQSRTFEIRHFRYITAGETEEQNTATRFIFDFKQGTISKCKREAGSCNANLEPDKDKSHSEGDSSKIKNELAMDPSTANLPENDLAIDQEDEWIEKDKAISRDVWTTKEKGAHATLSRIGGVLKSYTGVAKEALGALGVAGDVVGAIFVVIDLIDHNWVGSAIGAAGIGVGIGTAVAISGPVGWLIGGVITALFMILPGLFQDVKPLPDRTKPQEIIQWKMFGDRDHTGNEGCQKGTKDIPGNKDCVGGYGPGALAIGLGMSNFDAVIFLQQFNLGYPMTIKDMAAAFYVIDPDKKGDGGDKIATIDCHNSKGATGGRNGKVGADPPNRCAHPEFQVKREMIHLPNIDDTADKVLKRIIPEPKGDCKIVVHPGDQYYPGPNITLSGDAGAIACGITGAINVDGVAIPIDPDLNGIKPKTSSDSSQATDNSGGAYVAPPPAAPFKPLSQKDYVCLVSSKNENFCFPPGKYGGAQHDMGWNIRDINGLTLPGEDNGWKLATHYQGIKPTRVAGPDPVIDHTYTTNQDPKKPGDNYKDFTTDMDKLDKNREDQASFTVTGPNDGPDPVCCLFEKASFGGNVWCAGLGGGDVPKEWKDKAKSVSCHAGAQVWIYAEKYGDAGGALISGNVDDLKNEVYGKDKKSFSGNVKAVWIAKVK